MGHEGISKVDLVRGELAKDPSTPRYKMPSSTGLKRIEVSSAFSYLVRKGELPRPTRAESIRVMRDSVSDTRGGIFLIIEPYVEMGLKPMEIQERVYFEKGVKLNITQVRRAKNRVRSQARRSTPEFSETYNRIPIEAIETKKSQLLSFARSALKTGFFSERLQLPEALESKARKTISDILAKPIEYSAKEALIFRAMLYYGGGNVNKIAECIGLSTTQSIAFRTLAYTYEEEWKQIQQSQTRTS